MGEPALYPLGELLGRYDSQAQIQGISAARRHLEEEREKDAEESRRQGRVCQALGLTGWSIFGHPADLILTRKRGSHWT